jgi:hypothetical protein
VSPTKGARGEQENLDPHLHHARRIRGHRLHAQARLEPCTNERRERTVWLEDAMADRLSAMRPGESYSDVILRLAELGGWRP